MSEKKKTLKNSIKFETRIKQCMFVPDFSQFGETSVFRIKFAQKNTLGLSIWTNACNLRVTYFK